MVSSDRIQPKTSSILKFTDAHIWPLGAGALGVLLALLASFGLAGWAEASTLHHGIQHVLLFAAGISVGGGIIGWRKKEVK